MTLIDSQVEEEVYGVRTKGEKEREVGHYIGKQT